MNSVKGLANHDELIKMLSEMVRIESINPDYPGGKDGEVGMIKYLREFFDSEGIEYELKEALPGRHNVIAKLPGKTRDGVCFEAHMDTVTVEGMDDPFNPVIKDGLMYGRGTCDTKGGIACMAHALSMLKRNKIVPETDIYLAAVVDEEFQYRGVTHLLANGMKAKYAVVSEPTALKIVTACKGVIRFRVIAHGVAGHGARPEEGHNAIHDMASLLEEIKNTLIPSFDSRVHPMLGKPTLNVGVIKGGVLVNIIPDNCYFDADRRTLPGEDFATTTGEVQQLIDKLAKKIPGFDVEIDQTPLITDYAMETAQDAGIVKAAVAASDLIMGRHEIEGVSYCCDATKFHRAGSPSIIFGPGDIAQAHTTNEFIDISHLVPAAEFYAQLCLSPEL